MDETLNFIVGYLFGGATGFLIGVAYFRKRS